MAYLDTHGMNTLWAKIKATLGASLGISTSSSGVDVSLKNAAQTPTQLSSVTIPLVDKTNSKAGLISPTDKTKLDGIASGAEVNVQSDWSVTNTSSDAYIKNKPTIPTKVSDLTNDSGFVVPGDLATVATSGDYDDLTDKPTIPSANSTATNIKMDGTQSAGSLDTFAKADHIHPTDTTRAPLASPALTGTPTAPTAATGTNTTQIATTAFVKAAVDAATAGATAYQGTISSEAAFTAIANYTAGWYWIIDASFTHTLADSSTITVDAGNMVFANSNASAYSAANFDIIQADIEAIPDSVINALS